VGAVAPVVRGDHQGIAATGQPGRTGCSSHSRARQQRRHDSRAGRAWYRDDRSSRSGLSTRRRDRTGASGSSGARFRRNTCGCAGGSPRRRERRERRLPRQRQREQRRRVTVCAVRRVREQPAQAGRALQRAVRRNRQQFGMGREELLAHRTADRRAELQQPALRRHVPGTAAHSAPVAQPRAEPVPRLSANDGRQGDDGVAAHADAARAQR
jgi:hypothetical protein